MLKMTFDFGFVVAVSVVSAKSCTKLEFESSGWWGRIFGRSVPVGK